MQRIKRNAWLARRLKEIGETQAALAEVLGIGRPRVSELIAGSRTIRMHEWPVLSRFLRIPITELFDLATGDVGYSPGGVLESAKDELYEAALTDEATRKVYAAAKDLFRVMRLHELHNLGDITDEEIEMYALIIAQSAVKPELAETASGGRQMEAAEIKLQDWLRNDCES